MVTILSRPYDGLTPKQNGVYNGLPFVISSNMKTVPNFRYIAEVYVDGNKITELRHNGDISGNNNGVFDVGRVIENYISYDTQPYGSSNTTYYGFNSNRYYSVKFGEEFTRRQNIKRIYQASAYQIYVQFNNPHNLRVGDRVLISGSNVATYNGYKQVVGVGPNYIRIGITFTTAPTNYAEMSLFEGERIVKFGNSRINGINYVDLYVNINSIGTSGKLTYTRYNVGDTVILNQDTIAYQYYENTEWKVIAKTTTMYGDTLYARLTIDAPYQGTPATGGSLISKDNYVLKDQINTNADFSYAFNGVLQYNEDLSWDPKLYNFGTQSNTGKFLTKKVDRKVKVDYTDYWTLSTFGKQLNKVGSFIARIETWSTPTQGVINGTASSVSGIIDAGNSLMIVVNNASEYGVGDYVTVTFLSNTYSLRVVRKVSNTIYLDMSITLASSYPATIVQTIKVKYRMDATVKDTYTIIPCGPKNIIDTFSSPNEFTDGTCYKYFVWIGKYQTGTPLLYSDPYNNYDVWSEKFEFDMVPECTKYKTYKMTWLNEAGGFDYYKFSMRSDVTLNIERSEFTRKLKSQTTNGKYNYNTGDRGRTVYNVKSVEDIIVRTNWLDQNELDNISYIYESPEVYILEEATQKLTPVVIKNANVVKEQKVNRYEAGGLYIYEVEFEKATNRVIQSGGTIKNTATYNYNSNGGYDVWNNNWRNTWRSVQYTRAQYTLYNATYTKSLYE